MTTRDNGWENAPAGEQGLIPPDREKALAELLARAGGPGTATELHREGEALALFRSVVPVSSTPERGPAGIRPRVLVTALSALATGGLLATATAGGLTPSFRPPDRPTPRTSDTLASRTTPSATGSTTSVPPPGQISAQTVPGLCRFWLLSADPDGLTTVPLFRPLVTAAGGSGSIRSYCESRVGIPPSCPVPARDPLPDLTALPGRSGSGEAGPGGSVPSPVDPAVLPRRWPSTAVSDWPTSWPAGWPIPQGRDASSWTSWPGWISYCAETAHGPAQTTAGCGTGDPACPARTPAARPTPTAPGWTRSEPETCNRQGDTACQPDVDPGDRPVQDQPAADGHGGGGVGPRGGR
jgi:hypothetical protein